MHIYSNNQYDKLIYYLMVYPSKFKIINDSNPYKGKINYPLMYSQYNNFINILMENDVKIHFLKSMEGPSQVFTRDIGFVIKDILFISKLTSKERLEETKVLKNLAIKNNFKIYEMKNNIEGGDVILHNNVLFVGLSRRSSLNACGELVGVLHNLNIALKVIPIKFDNSKLHLDCVFNVIDKDTCLITDYVYDQHIMRKYFKHLIHLTGKPADNLGSNFICIGNKKIITSSKEVCNILNQNGYMGIYSDYSEIMKAGGSFNCSTLPILRM